MSDTMKKILEAYGVPNEPTWVTIEKGLDLKLSPLSARTFQREIRRCAAERGTETDEAMYLNEVEAWIATSLHGWRIQVGADVLEEYSPEDALELFCHAEWEMHYALAREKTLSWTNFRKREAAAEGKD